jgi:hypothetical protein
LEEGASFHGLIILVADRSESFSCAGIQRVAK